MCSVCVKNKFSDGSLKLFEEPVVRSALRLYDKATFFSAIMNVSYEFVFEENVVRAVVFDVYLKIVHSVLSMMPSRFAQGEKMPPQRYDPLVLLVTRRRGQLRARFLSKGAALLNHQGVYYDSGAP